MATKETYRRVVKGLKSLTRKTLEIQEVLKKDPLTPKQEAKLEKILKNLTEQLELNEHRPDTRDDLPF